MQKILIGIVLIVIIGLIGFFITTMDTPEPVEEDPVEVAENWIRENATTFTQREGSQLQHVDTLEEEGVYEITFDFESAFAGYGPEDDELSAQVITEHTIVVTVEDGEVTAAVTDGEYDELNQEFIEEETEEDMVEARVYFYVIDDGVEEVRSVTREFPAYQDIKAYALNELLEGPTQEETEEGYSTAIPEGTSLHSVYTEEGITYADFSEELDASGSATVTMIRDQVEKTLLQFEDVNEVVISIEGETEGILQP